jgi:hypothetical protein
MDIDPIRIQSIEYLQKMKYPTLIESQQIIRDHPLKSGLDPECRSTIPLCPESFTKVMKNIDTFIFDADG